MADIITLYRATAAFLMLYLLIRLQGKRQIGQFTFFDYALGLGLGTIAGAWAFDTRNPSSNYFISMLVFGVFGYVASYLSIRSHKIQETLQGKPSVVIENGQIREEKLKKNNISLEILLQKLRSKDVFNMADVEFAIIEPDGSLNVLKKSQASPVTPKQLKLPTEYHGLSQDIIINGQIMKENLQKTGLDERWIYEQLQAKSITSIANVSLASLDTQGMLYIDLKDEGIRKNDFVDENFQDVNYKAEITD